MLSLTWSSLTSMWILGAQHLSSSDYVALLRQISSAESGSVGALAHHLVVLLASLVLCLMGRLMLTHTGRYWFFTFRRVDVQVALIRLAHVVVLLAHHLVILHRLHSSVATMSNNSSRTRFIGDLCQTTRIVSYLLSSTGSNINACISAIFHSLWGIVLHLLKLSLYLCLGLCFVHALADKNIHK